MLGVSGSTFLQPFSIPFASMACGSLVIQSAEIFEKFQFQIAGYREQVLPLAEGYCHIADVAAFSTQELLPMMACLAAAGKTLILDDPARIGGLIDLLIARQPGHRLVAVDKNDKLIIPPMGQYDFKRLFILSEGYLIRRLWSKNTRRQVVLHEDLCKLPEQEVTFIGMSPGETIPSLEAQLLIMEADSIICFQGPQVEMLPENRSSLQVEVLPYDDSCYNVNVARVNEALVKLHLEGCLKVVVLQEGTAQVFDLPDRLSLFKRRFRFVESGLPVAVQLCYYLGTLQSHSILEPGYLLDSGFFRRYGHSPGEYRQRMERWLSLPLTCVLSEMYQGDPGLIYELIQTYGKHLILFENMFTEDQRLLFIGANQHGLLDLLGDFTGKMVTFALVDQRNLALDSPLYQQLIQKFGLSGEEKS